MSPKGTIRPHLIDTTLDAELDRAGYVKIPGFLDEPIIQEIKSLYDKYHLDRSDRQSLFWNSMNDISTDNGFILSRSILQLVKPNLDKIMEEYESPLAQIMSKNYGEISDVHLHRDTSIFDENKYTYLNIWIPLVDTTESTGGMFFLPGSHKVFTYPKIHVFTWHYHHLRNELMPYTKFVSAKAGDCVIFSDRTLHGSYQNQTQDFRPVVFLGAMHPDAQIRYYYYDEKTNLVRVYEVPHDFYFKKDFSEPIGMYPVVESFDYNPSPLSGEVVINELNKLS